MDKTTYIMMACGFVSVGILFVVMDYFAARLNKDVNPPGSTVWKDESELTFATEGERKRFRMRRKNALAVQSHRMRRNGILVAGIGLFALLALLFTPDFQSFPSKITMAAIGNALTKKVHAPWGPFSIPGAVILVAIAVFLFAAGREHWRLRRNYFNAVLCFLLGLIILLEGVCQWQ